MSTFNYRGLIRTNVSPAGNKSYTVDIYEVYYNNKGKIIMRTKEPKEPYGSFESDGEIADPEKKELYQTLKLDLVETLAYILKDITVHPLMTLEEVDFEIAKNGDDDNFEKKVKKASKKNKKKKKK